jgi:hypothetical protein
VTGKEDGILKLYKTEDEFTVPKTFRPKGESTTRPYTLRCLWTNANINTRQQGTYIITVTDDYSRYTTIYLLEVRNARHEGIQKYTKTRLERTVKKIRPHREVEYTAVHLKSFMKHEGIQHTEPYIPKKGRKKEEPWWKLKMHVNKNGTAQMFWERR